MHIFKAAIKYAGNTNTQVVLYSSLSLNIRKSH